MENKKTLTEEIVGAVRGEFQLFKVEMTTEVREELQSFKGEMIGEVKGETGLLRNEFRSLQNEMQLFKIEVNERFDMVDKSFDRLEIMMEDMDGKFTLITEGQDVIREVLETRVAHIEEVLGVENRA